MRRARRPRHHRRQRTALARGPTRWAPATCWPHPHRRRAAAHCRCAGIATKPFYRDAQHRRVGAASDREVRGIALRRGRRTLSRRGRKPECSTRDAARRRSHRRIYHAHRSGRLCCFHLSRPVTPPRTSAPAAARPNRLRRIRSAIVRDESAANAMRWVWPGSTASVSSQNGFQPSSSLSSRRKWWPCRWNAVATRCGVERQHDRAAGSWRERRGRRTSRSWPAVIHPARRPA